MNRYKITNLVSGSEYAITDADLARFGQTLEQRLAAKINAYGHTERRFPSVDAGFGWLIRQGVDGLEYVTTAVPESIDPDTQEVTSEAVPERVLPLQEVRPEWYLVAAPILDGEEVVVSAEHSVEVEDMSHSLRAQQIAALWTKADQLANAIADQNARARFLAWMIDPATPAPAKDLIAQLQAAMDSIWTQYAAGKAAILAGNEPAPIVAPSNLPTFWDVAAAAAQEPNNV